MSREVGRAAADESGRHIAAAEGAVVELAGRCHDAEKPPIRVISLLQVPLNFRCWFVIALPDGH